MKKTYRFYKILGISAISIVALVLILLVAVRVVLSDKVLTNLVNKYANEYLDARVKIDSVELSIFKEFPYAGVRLMNGEVISNVTSKDSLLSFKELVISVSIPKILVSKFDIKRIKIVSPRIFAFVNEVGQENWNIVKDMPSDTTSVEGDFALDLNINRVNISDGGSIIYDNRKDSILATISLNQLRLRGNIALDQNDMRVERGMLSKFSVTIEKLLAQKDNFISYDINPDSISLRTEMYGVGAKKSSASLMVDSLNISSGKRGDFNIHAITHSNFMLGDLVLANNIPLEISGGVAFDSVARGNIALNDLKVGAVGIPFVFNGNVSVDKDGVETSNLCARVEEFKLENFIKYIPAKIFPLADKLNTDAILNMDADFKGRYDFASGEIPSVEFTMQVPKSQIKIKGEKLGLDELVADINGFYNSKNLDSSGIRINKFVAKGIGIDFSAKGNVSKIATDPYFNMELKSAFNLDTLAALFPPKRSDVVLKGAIKSDFKFKSALSNLSVFNLEKSNISGDFDSDSLRISFPSMDFYCYAQNLCLKMGAMLNTRDSSIKMGMSMVGLAMNIDSLNLRHTDSLIIKGSGLVLRGHNSSSILTAKAPQDSTKITVHPFNGQITAKRLEVAGLDSSRVVLVESVNNLSILPYNGDISIPHIKLSSKNRRFGMRSNINRYSLVNGTIYIDAVRQIIIPKGRARGARSMQFDESSNIDLKVEDKMITGFLRNWTVKGSVNAQRGRVTTPYFPLQNRLSNINIGFTLDSIIIKNTTFNLGESNIKATGNIAGMRASLLRGSRAKIRANLNILSDTLNFNELILAAIKGGEYLESSESFKDSLMAINSEESLQKSLKFDTPDSVSNSMLIVIPANIDAKLHLDVDYGKYGNMILHQAAGDLIVRDRCLLIEKFDTKTSAGEMILDAFYSTKSKDDISVGFDLELKDLHVDQFISLVPSIDTLLPMLSSFKGIINCQMAATAQLDTNMNFLMNSINGVAKIKGDSLVLMDGETFTEISKMLYFKNKKRNLVEKIAVEILVKDSNIEVFPFVMEIDRYRTAISGKQDMDLNFKYHISVLKSPVPIRLGVNIYGNLDDFHFRIGKAKYKSANLPVYTHVIDQTRLNLRDYISNIFDKGVDAAMKEGINSSALSELRVKYGDTLSTHIETLSAQDSVAFK